MKPDTMPMDDEWAQLVGDLISAISGIKADAGRGGDINFDAADILVSVARKKLGRERTGGWIKEDVSKDEITVGLPTKVNQDHPLRGMPIRMNPDSVVICEILVEDKSHRVVGFTIQGFRKQEKNAKDD